MNEYSHLILNITSVYAGSVYASGKEKPPRSIHQLFLTPYVLSVIRDTRMDIIECWMILSKKADRYASQMYM